VADDELLSIGRFAQKTGLSVHTPRHYDEVGLLPPAETDPLTGYRRYRREQIRAAAPSSSRSPSTTSTPQSPFTNRPSASTTT